MGYLGQMVKKLSFCATVVGRQKGDITLWHQSSSGSGKKK